MNTNSNQLNMDARSSMNVEGQRRRAGGSTTNRSANTRSAILRVLFFLATVLLFQTFTRGASADDNDNSWSSFTELSAGASIISTKAITQGDAGFTFGIAQGILFNRFVFSLGFDGSYYIVKTDRTPLARSLRIFDVKPSVGYLTPAGPLSLSLEAFYKLRQFRGNGIVAQTGDDPVQHAVGIASTIRYPATRTLFVALRPYYAVTVSTLSPVHEIGALFVVGFSASID